MNEPSPLYKLLYELNGKVEAQGAQLTTALSMLKTQGEQIEALRESKWRAKGGIAVISAAFGVGGAYLLNLLRGH